MIAAVLAVDAAHWPGAAGWLYRNCAGNLAASALWGPVGLGVGYGFAKARDRTFKRRHDEIVALHEAAAGERAAILENVTP